MEEKLIAMNKKSCGTEKEAVRQTVRDKTNSPLLSEVAVSEFSRPSEISQASKQWFCKAECDYHHSTLCSKDCKKAIEAERVSLNESSLSKEKSQKKLFLVETEAKLEQLHIYSDMKIKELTPTLEETIQFDVIDDVWCSQYPDRYAWMGKLIPLKKDTPFQTKEITEGKWYKEDDVQLILQRIIKDVFQKLKESVK
jgi:hypothetical protein